jgi:hypothetical protein
VSQQTKIAEGSPMSSTDTPYLLAGQTIKAGDHGH